ncbi:uncharacterized protein LOC101242794 [Ciona intestinalis]
MGNTKSYNQVPTSGNDPEDLTVDKYEPTEKSEDNDDHLMFVFHTTDGDSTERVVHDEVLPENQKFFTYTVTANGKLFAERDRNIQPIEIDDLLKHLRPGDAVEFLRDDLTFHWAMFVGNRMFVHLENEQVISHCVDDIKGGRRARMVNNVYKARCLPSVQCIHNAKAQIGRKDSIWKNSECFVMWCRTNQSEFAVDDMRVKDLDATPSKNLPKIYVLEIYDSDEVAEVKKFSSISELTDFRQNFEKMEGR